ncbi:iron-sulfur cluster co-chaperone protein HscB-like [Rhopilema esculentum]|uniref:iron-sulfur cluster co-chaperone protein HscB-like n=1 Tax=Rhopilema esculentum TaxID=499914 RepID=UPI0031D54BB9
MQASRINVLLRCARPLQNSSSRPICCGARFSSDWLRVSKKECKHKDHRLLNYAESHLCNRGHTTSNSCRDFSSKRFMCGVRSANRTCWNCNREIGTEIFFCDLCKKIQPPLTELSFFQIFRSPEIYGANVRDLTIQYRELQGMIHPDKFGSSLEEERQYSAEQSSLINKAYNTLIDPLTRAVYLLSLNGVEIGEENTVGDTEFLMEVMETNEKLSEVKTSKDLDDIRKINNDAIDSCIENLFISFENRDFAAAKEWTIKFRYYRNILEIVKEKTLEIDQ